MASPIAKNSISASRTTKPVTKATTEVGANSTRPAKTGIRSAAVTTLFQVIERESPTEQPSISHHNKGMESRKRITGQKRKLGKGKPSLANYARRLIAG